MELPKNITQIGESDKSCKIYVEDYVVSYIKQRNRLAENKKTAVALYGVRKEENEVSYLFLYGAGKLDSIQREVRHLSQAQNQEIESIRRRYFEEYQFLGYRLLDGEMVEGFHVCEQGICRYISGYAQFYEKNDMMLAYMLDTREDEPKPEEVNQEKYERVRQRQEERRSRSGNTWQAADRQTENSRPESPAPERREAVPENVREDAGTAQSSTGGAESRFRASAPRNRREEPRPMARQRAREQAGANSAGRTQPSKSVAAMRTCIVGAFVVLCVLGVASMNGGLENLQVAARQFVEGITEQKIPDADAIPAMNQEGPDMLVTEDKLTDAIKKENEAGENGGQSGTDNQNPVQEQDGMVAQPGSGGQQAESAQPVNGEQAGTALQPGAEGQAGSDGQISGTSTAPADQAGTEAGAAGAVDQAGANSQTGGTSADSGSRPGGAGMDPGGQTGGTGTEPGSQTSGTGTVPQPGSEGQAGGDGQAGTAPQPETKETIGPVGYVIQKGDTLIGISFRQYGTDTRVQEICDLNKIENPDNIRIGQKILLPQ